MSSLKVISSIYLHSMITRKSNSPRVRVVTSTLHVHVDFFKFWSPLFRFLQFWRCTIYPYTTCFFATFVHNSSLSFIRFGIFLVFFSYNCTLRCRLRFHFVLSFWTEVFIQDTFPLHLGDVQSESRLRVVNLSNRFLHLFMTPFNLR